MEYARAFARVGFAVLVYDHRNFGMSDGEPRLKINPWIQCRGYLDAMTYACAHDAVDPERIGLWGLLRDGDHGSRGDRTADRARAAGCVVREIATGHDTMLTAPDAVAKLLLDVADAA